MNTNNNNGNNNKGGRSDGKVFQFLFPELLI